MNVRPGALAGNHTPLDPTDVAVSQDDATAVVVNGLPDGDLDTHVAWVAEGGDCDEASERADVVWARYEYDGTVNPADLSRRLREATLSRSQVGETDGLGEAVNADTGETTQPGDPLPLIEQDNGEPLTPTSGDDSDEVAPESTDTLDVLHDGTGDAVEPQNSTGSDDGGNTDDF